MNKEGVINMGISAVGTVNGLGSGLASFGRPMSLHDIGPIVNEGFKPFSLQETVPLISVKAPEQISNLDSQIGPTEQLKPAVPDVGGRFEPLESLSSLKTIVTNPALEQEAKPKVEPAIAPRVIKETAGKLIGVVEPTVVRRPIEVMPQIKPQIEAMPVPLVISSSILELAPQAKEVLQPQQKASNATRLSTTTLPTVEPQMVTEKQVEEMIEEVVKSKEEEIFEEVVETRQKFYLVDKQALIQRIYEIRQAFRKAVAEIKKTGGSVEKILGQILAKFMPPEHPKVRSSALTPADSDGSYEATLRLLENGQFNSEDQAEQTAFVHRPVEIGEKGERVSQQEVSVVFKNRFVKPMNKAIEIITKRHIKKRTVQAIKEPLALSFGTQPARVKAELDLKDLELEEVFQKAA